MMDESKLPTVFRKKLPPNLEKIKYGKYVRSDLDYSVHLHLRENDIRVQENGSEIVQFLRGKNILVTGATGYLGKMLVEKLLRSCKDIGKIYIIVRNKRGKELQTRVNEFLNSWVFCKLADIYPDFREKVVGIAGDFEQDGLGLSEESKNILKENVNILYHVAATVRFDEKLKKAVKVNIEGTREIISLAKACKKLDVFVHLSTAYSNCHQPEAIEEKFYQPHIEPENLINLAKVLPEETVDRITAGLLGSAPNTYAFTKQITEDVVRREAVGIPTCIHRPSIVTASVNEPAKNWTDSIYGPTGLITAGAVGLLHVFHGDPNGRCDLVPADYVINSIIASSYKAAKDRLLDQIQIFNYTSADENPTTWSSLEMCKYAGEKTGSVRVVSKHFSAYTTCYYWFVFLHFFLHTCPAHLLDFIAVQLGKKPQLKEAFKKINKYIEVLTHFTMNEFMFINKNSRELWDSLSDVDKKNFPFDMKTLDWQYYFDSYCAALREFIVHDFFDTLEEGRTLVWRVTILHWIGVTLIGAVSIYVFVLNKFLFFVPLTVFSIILFYAIGNIAQCFRNLIKT